MGTKGSYKGGGGASGKKLREAVTGWHNSTPIVPPTGPDKDEPPDPADHSRPIPQPLRPDALLPAIGLFRPRRSGGGDGPGAMGGGPGGSERGRSGRSGGGAQRSATRSASTAGRAVAAAYALRIGDTSVLDELELSYSALRQSDDPIDVTSQIVQAACGPLSDGTIEDDERRIVAAQLAEWVLTENEGGAPPDPVEIVQEAIALIMFEAVTSETAAKMRDGNRPLSATRDAERQIRDSAHALATRADLSLDGPTPAEFERAIERGIETLRTIWGGG